eukprot:scaffold181545_cov37-Prasinocladus_malaysianus.AAC.1
MVGLDRLDCSSNLLWFGLKLPSRAELEKPLETPSTATPGKAASIRVSTRPGRLGAGRRGDGPPGGISAGSPYASGTTRGKTRVGGSRAKT